MTRLEGWEARLAAVIEEARGEAYVLGRHDCFRVVCRGVQALTGVDLWSAWAGTYRTRAQALRRIAEFGGGSFDDAFSRLFGVAPVAVQLARRGDVVKYLDRGGTPHLGLCNGPTVAVLEETGLAFVELSACESCWRIG